MSMVIVGIINGDRYFNPKKNPPNKEDLSDAYVLTMAYLGGFLC